MLWLVGVLWAGVLAPPVARVAASPTAQAHLEPASWIRQPLAANVVRPRLQATPPWLRPAPWPQLATTAPDMHAQPEVGVAFWAPPLHAFRVEVPATCDLQWVRRVGDANTALTVTAPLPPAQPAPGPANAERSYELVEPVGAGAVWWLACNANATPKVWRLAANQNVRALDTLRTAPSTLDAMSIPPALRDGDALLALLAPSTHDPAQRAAMQQWRSMLLASERGDFDLYTDVTHHTPATGAPSREAGREFARLPSNGQWIWSWQLTEPCALTIHARAQGAPTTRPADGRVAIRVEQAAQPDAPAQTFEHSVRANGPAQASEDQALPQAGATTNRTAALRIVLPAGKAQLRIWAGFTTSATTTPQPLAASPPIEIGARLACRQPRWPDAAVKLAAPSVPLHSLVFATTPRNISRPLDDAGAQLAPELRELLWGATLARDAALTQLIAAAQHPKARLSDAVMRGALMRLHQRTESHLAPTATAAAVNAVDNASARPATAAVAPGHASWQPPRATVTPLAPRTMAALLQLLAERPQLAAHRAALAIASWLPPATAATVLARAWRHAPATSTLRQALLAAQRQAPLVAIAPLQYQALTAQAARTAFLAQHAQSVAQRPHTIATEQAAFSTDSSGADTPTAVASARSDASIVAVDDASLARRAPSQTQATMPREQSEAAFSPTQDTLANTTPSPLRRQLSLTPTTGVTLDLPSPAPARDRITADGAIALHRIAVDVYVTNPDAEPTLLVDQVRYPVVSSSTPTRLELALAPGLHQLMLRDARDGDALAIVHAPGTFASDVRQVRYWHAASGLDFPVAPGLVRLDVLVPRTTGAHELVLRTNRGQRYAVEIAAVATEAEASELRSAQSVWLWLPPDTERITLNATTPDALVRIIQSDDGVRESLAAPGGTTSGDGAPAPTRTAQSAISQVAALASATQALFAAPSVATFEARAAVLASAGFDNLATADLAHALTYGPLTAQGHSLLQTLADPRRSEFLVVPARSTITSGTLLTPGVSALARDANHNERADLTLLRRQWQQYSQSRAVAVPPQGAPALQTALGKRVAAASLGDVRALTTLATHPQLAVRAWARDLTVAALHQQTANFVAHSPAPREASGPTTAGPQAQQQAFPSSPASPPASIGASHGTPAPVQLALLASLLYATTRQLAVEPWHGANGASELAPLVTRWEPVRATENHAGFEVRIVEDWPNNAPPVGLDSPGVLRATLAGVSPQARVATRKTPITQRYADAAITSAEIECLAPHARSLFVPQLSPAPCAYWLRNDQQLQRFTSPFRRPQRHPLTPSAGPHQIEIGTNTDAVLAVTFYDANNQRVARTQQILFRGTAPQPVELIVLAPTTLRVSAAAVAGAPTLLRATTSPLAPNAPALNTTTPNAPLPPTSPPPVDHVPAGRIEVVAALPRARAVASGAKPERTVTFGEATELELPIIGTGPYRVTFAPDAGALAVTIAQRAVDLDALLATCGDATSGCAATTASRAALLERAAATQPDPLAAPLGATRAALAASSATAGPLAAPPRTSTLPFTTSVLASGGLDAYDDIDPALAATRWRAQLALQWRGSLGAARWLLAPRWRQLAGLAPTWEARARYRQLPGNHRIWYQFEGQIANGAAADTSTRVWAGSAAAQIGANWQAGNHSLVIPSLRIAAAHTPDTAPNAAVDPLVFSQYRADHPLQWTASLTYWLAPRANHHLSSNVFAVSNAVLYSLDMVAAALQWSAHWQQGGPAGLITVARYQPSLRFADDHRSTTAWRHDWRLGLYAPLPLPAQTGRWTLGAFASLAHGTGALPPPSLELWLRWDDGRRGLADFSNDEIDFEDEQTRTLWRQP